MEINFGEIPPNTLFDFAGNTYRKVEPYRGCCPSNYATAFNLSRKEPAFFNDGQFVTPTFWEVIKITEIPAVYNDLPFYNKTFNHLLINPVHVNTIIDRINNDTQTLEYWQIYSTNCLHMYNYTNDPFVDYEPSDFGWMKFFGLIDTDPEPLYIYVGKSSDNL